LVLAIAVGVAGVIWQAGVAAHQRDVARNQADRAERMSNALIEMISVSDPSESGLDAGAHEQVLDYLLARVDDEFAGDGPLQTQLLVTVGRGYSGVGAQDKAEPILRRSLPLIEQYFGERSELMSDAYYSLGSVIGYKGDYELSLEYQQKSLEIWRDVAGPDTGGEVDCLVAIAATLGALARYAEAESVVVTGLAITERMEEPPALYQAKLYHTLSGIYDAWSRFDESKQNYLKALEIWREELGETHPLVASGVHDLAITYHREGGLAEAERLYRESLSITRKLHVTGSELANTLNSLGKVLCDRGKFDAAEPLLRESLTLNMGAVGENSLQTGATHLTLAQALQGQEKYEESWTHFGRGTEIFGEVFGTDHLYYGVALSYQGNQRRLEGRIEEAETLLRAAVGIQQPKLPVGRERLAFTWWSLGELDLERGRLRSAETSLGKAFELYRETQTPRSVQLAEAQAAYGACLGQLGRGEDGLLLLKEASGVLLDVLGPQDERTVTAQRRLAALASIKEG